MLSADRVSFRYAGCDDWVLRDLTLHVAPGEVVGLSGPSGRGKTTLGRLLAGYLRPLAGQITLDAAALPGGGFCPVQLIFQHPELAINPRWRIARALSESGETPATLMTSLGIESGWLTRWPHELSGGELQRVAVARALRPQTRYLIADEMTSMLDAVTQAQIWHVILDFARRQNVGLLVISHEAALLDRICDRAQCVDDLASECGTARTCAGGRVAG